MDGAFEKTSSEGSHAVTGVVAVAARIAKRPQNRGKTIAVVLPDSGERYLSTALFEGITVTKELAA